MKLLFLSVCCFSLMWFDVSFLLYLPVILISNVNLWYTKSFTSIFSFDKISMFFSLINMTVFIICLMSFFSWEINLIDSSYQVKLMMILTMLAMLTFLTTALFYFYVYLEVTFIFMFHFLMKSGLKMERKVSSYYMFFFTMLPSLPLLIVILMLMDLYKANMMLMSSNWSGYWSMLIFLVFFVKMPLFGLHMWLPKAHVEAPLSGSIFLSGVLLKLGFYGVIRLFQFSKMTIVYKITYITCLSWLSSAMITIICLKQLDIKSMVAYSSVVHMSMACASLFAATETSLKATLFMCYSHGISSPMMFYGVYTFYNMTNSRSVLLSKGFLNSNPLFLMSMFFIMMSSLGVPPFLSFFGEMATVSSVLIHSHLFLFPSIILLFTAGVYMMYFYTYFIHGVQSKMVISQPLGIDMNLIFILIVMLLLSPYFLFSSL